MLKFFKKLFGINNNDEELCTESSGDNFNWEPKKEDPIIEKYFKYSLEISNSLSEKNYQKVAKISLETVEILSRFITAYTKESGEFNISTIHAIEHGGTALALCGNEEGIMKMIKVVKSIPELSTWHSVVDGHFEDLKTIQAINSLISNSQGTLQNKIKTLINHEDGRKVANLINWMEKSGSIKRVKEGNTYAVFTDEIKNIPIPESPKISKIEDSHRKGSKAPLIKEISLNNLEIIFLPKSPKQWELEKKPQTRTTTEFFESSWEIIETVKLESSQKPDFAYRKYYPINQGLILLDDLGNAEICKIKTASLMAFTSDGKRLAEKALDYKTYRFSAKPTDSGCIGIDDNGTIHAYNLYLENILLTNAQESPEAKALAKKVQSDKLSKYDIRCVDLSKDNSHYLITAIDEAWCTTIDGDFVWGVKLPLKEGWGIETTSSERYGTDQEVTDSIKLLELSIPYSTKELKKQYWDFAKKWHPDKNRNNPEACEKMKEINRAVEVLTGVDPHSLVPELASVYTKTSETIELGDGFTISLCMSGDIRSAADWIYAASFSGNDNGVFLAGYSGKVIHISAEGIADKAYDIGTVPQSIIEIGSYLYIQTYTRLLILKNDGLLKVIDTYDEGSLIVTQTGFGLLQKKLFKWFSPEGEYQGEVITKNPIRRVYHDGDNLVVETRERRAILDCKLKWF